MMDSVDVLVTLNEIKSKYCLANSRQEKAINIAIDAIKNKVWRTKD